jgi:hypothetical protein
MATQVSDRELAAAIQNKLDEKGSSFGFTIRMMIRQYVPAVSTDEARKIPQQKRTSFLERLGSL